MTVAVVIPAYIRTPQAQEWLAAAVASVQRQTFAEVACVVVDDASPIPVKLPGVKVLRHDRNRGPGAARNTGIAATSAEWILPLDADDLLEPDAVARLYAARCPVEFTYGDVQFFGDRSGIASPGEFSLQALLAMTGKNPVTSLFAKAAWRRAGGFDERLEGLEDVDFFISLAANGICGRHIDGVTLHYRRYGESRHAALEQGNRERLIAVREQLQQKHWRVTMAKCDRCPGGSGPGKGVGVSDNTNIGANGVDLQYIGRMIASFVEAPSPITGRRYLIEGTGTWVRVAPEDVAWLLGMPEPGGGRKYRQPEPEAPTPNLLANVPLPEAEVPDITTLNAKDAAALIKDSADPLDLRVWLAQESAADAPRKTVLDALNKRLGELSND